MMMQQSLEKYRNHGVEIAGGFSHLVLGTENLYGKIIVVLDEETWKLHLFGELRSEWCEFLLVSNQGLLAAVKSGMVSYNIAPNTLSHGQVYEQMKRDYPAVVSWANSKVVGGAAAFYFGDGNPQSLYINDFSGTYNHLFKGDLNLCLREQQQCLGLEVHYGEDVLEESPRV